MSTLNIFQISSDDHGIRLDRWLRKKFGRVPQAQVEKLSRTGQIRLDGRRVKASTRVKGGQVIKVPPFENDTKKLSRKKQYNHDPQDLNLIKEAEIYRDDDIIVINKPPGIAVQGGSKVRRHIDGLMEGLCKPGEKRPKLVHRLDRETSGVLVLARNSFTARELAKAFREREVEKTYWAIVLGTPSPAKGQVDLPLDKRGEPGKEKIFSGTGRRAVTRYAVIDNAGQDVAWMALYPETGRTHQIRVHCSAIGSPIIGDRKYGARLAIQQGLPFGNRLHLHSRAIKLQHPRKGLLELKAEPPHFMFETMKYFGFERNLGDLVDQPDLRNS
ncbi:MAG: RluA family pseudouridine synthase [Pseudomonadota bacterium]|nr:RluA family pseudouridine synthase [Pseudomonadota bacterium]